jgi:hypothetical protein
MLLIACEHIEQYIVQYPNIIQIENIDIAVKWKYTYKDLAIMISQRKKFPCFHIC